MYRLGHGPCHIACNVDAHVEADIDVNIDGSHIANVSKSNGELDRVIGKQQRV